ncbi:MAG: hypothetical protein ACOYVF_13090 [Candidatus Zixiibacteriota bacterium]
MKKSIIVITILFVSAVSAMSQTTDQAILDNANSNNLLGSSPASSPFKLLDLSKMKWTHSYTMGYVSVNGSSGSVGMWNTTMFYEFSRKLSLSLNIGIMNTYGSIWGDANNDATVLPGFLLDYHPSDKFNLIVGFQRVSGAYPYYYGDGYNRWHSWGFPY